MSETFGTLLEKGKALLRKKQIADADLDAWLLMEHVFHIDRSGFFLHTNDNAQEDHKRIYLDMIEVRGQHVPLQQIIGEAWFYGRSFYVNDQVLIPRQDTECLVEEVLKHGKGVKTILDMCTGSGCILITLLNELSQCSGTGADLSLQALQAALINLERYPCNAQFVQSDLFTQVKGTYDIIVSNPPYIQSSVIKSLMEEVRSHEPLMALDGKEDGLFFYREIIGKASCFLKKGGWLFFEIGFDQGDDVTAMLRETGYHKIEIVKDLAGLDRVVLGQWD